MHALDLLYFPGPEAYCGSARWRIIQSLAIIGLMLIGGQVSAATFDFESIPSSEDCEEEMPEFETGSESME